MGRVELVGCLPSPSKDALQDVLPEVDGGISRKLVEANLERADADLIAASVAIAQKLGKLTLVDWVQADETTVNRRAMEALEHCRCYWYSSGVGSNYSRRTVENT